MPLGQVGQSAFVTSSRELEGIVACMHHLIGSVPRIFQGLCGVTGVLELLCGVADNLKSVQCGQPETEW